MNRRDFAALLLALGPAGCDFFADKKQPLPGERISVNFNAREACSG